MKKKILAMLLALMMVVSLLPATVFAADEDTADGDVLLSTPADGEDGTDGEDADEPETGADDSKDDAEGDDPDATEPGDGKDGNDPTEPDVIASGTYDEVEWTLTDDGVLTIEGTGSTGGYMMTEPMGVPWADYRDEIRTVVIGDGITDIGPTAFMGCANLTDVTIPDSVTAIGPMAFSDCTGLTGVTIPDGVTTILDYAFSDCTGLTSVTIPDSVTVIYRSAFAGCTGLTSVTIPASVTEIWDGAFDECTSLTDVSFGGTAAQWGEIISGMYKEVTFANGGQGLAGLADVTVHCTDGDIEPTEPEPKTEFNDVSEKDYYYSAVQFAVSEGLISGDGKGNFNPNNDLTRVQAFTILARLDGETIAGDTWKDDAIAWATASGVSDGTNPSGGVTREQLVVMLWRMVNKPAAEDASVLDDFADSSDIHSWAEEAMAWAVEAGIVQGNTHGLNPGGVATRAQGVTMVQRCFDWLLSQADDDVGGMGG